MMASFKNKSPLVCAFLFLIVEFAAGTWSIVGVDPRIREVGVAVASCVALPPEAMGGMDIVALAPGKGAGITQASVNFEVPPLMASLLSNGTTPEEIIDIVTSSSFDEFAQTRQHGVVTLNGLSEGFTGDEAIVFGLDEQAPQVSAQGNILVSNKVITNALTAFGAEKGANLTDRLVDALLAGSNTGGDWRCLTQTALFALVVVAKPDDNSSTPTIRLNISVELGDGRNPVTLLASQYRKGTMPKARPWLNVRRRFDFLLSPKFYQFLSTEPVDFIRDVIKGATPKF